MLTSFTFTFNIKGEEMSDLETLIAELENLASSEDDPKITILYDHIIDLAHTVKNALDEKCANCACSKN